MAIDTDEEPAFIDLSKVVWEARYKKHRAIIKGTQPVPNWIHEYGSSVRWKVLEGHEELDKLAINKKHGNTQELTRTSGDDDWEGK